MQADAHNGNAKTYYLTFSPAIKQQQSLNGRQTRSYYVIISKLEAQFD